MIVSNWVAVRIDADGYRRTRGRSAGVGESHLDEQPDAVAGCLQGDRPAGHVGQLGHDREPQTGAARLAASGARQKRSVARARSAIDIPGPWSRTDTRVASASAATTTSIDAARRSDRERVVEQVVEDLLEVRPRRRGPAPSAGAVERTATRRARRRAVSIARPRRPRPRPRRRSLAVERLAARQRQQPLDELAETLELRVDRLQVGPSGGRVTVGSERGVLERLDPETEGGERRAELVRGVRDEGPLGPDQHLEPCGHVVERRRRGAAARVGRGPPRPARTGRRRRAAGRRASSCSTRARSPTWRPASPSDAAPASTSTLSSPRRSQLSRTCSRTSSVGKLTRTTPLSRAVRRDGHRHVGELLAQGVGAPDARWPACPTSRSRSRGGWRSRAGRRRAGRCPRRWCRRRR